MNHFETFDNISSGRECLKICYRRQGCTHFSWNHTESEESPKFMPTKCTILTRPLDKREIDSIYFCEKNGSTIGRREFLCQRPGEITETWNVTKLHKLKNSNSNKADNLAQCWKDLCKDCSFFSWNPDKKECNVSNEATEVGFFYNFDRFTSHFLDWILDSKKTSHF